MHDVCYGVDMHDMGRMARETELAGRGKASHDAVTDSSVPQIRLDEATARRLTEQIRVLLVSVQEQVDALVRLVEEARAGNAHAALGYRSWSEYAEREFGRTPLRLPKEGRQELVVRLTELGMSTRAIGPVVGVDQKTVSNDRRAVEESSSTETRTVTGRDGKEYVVRPNSKAGTERDENEEVGEGNDRRTSAPRPRTNVVAVMSRVVTRATDAAFAADELKKEHFKQRKEEATRWARDLETAIQSLQRLADLLKEQTE